MAQPERRTDREIQADVAEELVHTPELDAEHVDVTVRAGIVTLSGSVRSSKDRYLAEDTAAQVANVRAVADEMVVRARGLSGGSDSDLAVLAARMLESTPDVPTGSVRVAVRNGVLTLTGDVASEHQRGAASRAVERISGVVGVNNDIHVTPARPDDR
jgi:osmotically-inducible protein OsmY